DLSNATGDLDRRVLQTFKLNAAEAKFRLALHQFRHFLPKHRVWPILGQGGEHVLFFLGILVLILLERCPFTSVAFGWHIPSRLHKRGELVIEALHFTKLLTDRLYEIASGPRAVESHRVPALPFASARAHEIVR